VINPVVAGVARGVVEVMLAHRGCRSWLADKGLAPPNQEAGRQ
jgi:hypothetical protein